MLKKALFCCVLFFVALPAHAEETATVIIYDMPGKDIEQAVQMAAEAALTQVVGSFIDSDKLIEKRKEIKGLIKTQTSPSPQSSVSIPRAQLSASMLLRSKKKTA